MAREPLDRLAESHGIQIRYKSELGEAKEIPDAAKSALLRTLKVDPDAGEAGAFDAAEHRPALACALPEEAAGHKRWGVTCQLYALRSQRSLGIGDFEDLGHLAEIAAAEGASFVGVNPLHALFLSDAGRYSPYSPSTRRFLNPFYLAIDALPGGPEALAAARRETPDAFAALGGELVDYAAVGTLKRRLLQAAYGGVRDGLDADEDFRAFCEKGGDALRDFSLFEAISAHMREQGGAAGWHGWPDAFHKRSGEAVRAFEAENADALRFHEWLQFQCDRQLGGAQRRAKAAGMAIGLYLDFAVGVSPDGAETWADPDLTVREARVGSPPDMFNSEGQDWGLAPLSPRALAERNYAPLASAYAALMEHAGAIRIDHAMGLARLWWIPETSRSGGGGYVRYPLGAMVDAVARVSQDMRCVVIGEDLGTVPEGFRDVMHEANILAYKVLYFERWEDGLFKAAGEYPARSLACISTHDLATLAGWWRGADIRLRSETGRQDEAATARDLQGRARERRTLLAALDHEGLLSPEWAAAARGEGELPAELGQDLALAVHRFGARTGSMLFAVQVEDMVLAERQPNLPGTMDEYPNWRIRSDVALEDLGADQRFQAMARALRQERPETA
ncbi:4-alpha-glucanotransferase [Aureimonas flava]|uniref:4-alpha-glucanotransferase n=1 Tax=Aureimonas flava TaxID=2320271 RepID=A0A3A1WJL8_9HYPH|nr:4-alpha-glucanotransferase [Aureimonas flava]RIY00142.1 4-alpha-glucanotransferase [Aureimonas flava]